MAEVAQVIAARYPGLWVFSVKLPVSSTVRFPSNSLCHPRYIFSQTLYVIQGTFSSQTPYVIHGTFPIKLPMLSTVRFQSNPCHPWYVFRQTPCVIHGTFLVKLPVSSTVRFQSNFLCHRRYVSSQTPHVIHSTVPVILPMSSTVRFCTGLIILGDVIYCRVNKMVGPLLKWMGVISSIVLVTVTFTCILKRKASRSGDLCSVVRSHSHTFFFSFLSFVGDRCVTGKLWYLC